ncbi:MAG: hypothetical protein OXFUSZZB_001900, partial [Candidatus Fervidibacter sp.]
MAISRHLSPTILRFRVTDGKLGAWELSALIRFVGRPHRGQGASQGSGGQCGASMRT